MSAKKAYFLVGLLLTVLLAVPGLLPLRGEAGKLAIGFPFPVLVGLGLALGFVCSAVGFRARATLRLCRVSTTGSPTARPTRPGRASRSGLASGSSRWRVSSRTAAR